MRIEAAGANITDAVVEVLDDLQNESAATKLYLETLDEVTRDVVLNPLTIDEGSDTQTLAKVRALQMIRKMIMTLAMPPDVDNVENDKPILSI